jgi:hypothetical protein
MPSPDFVDIFDCEFGAYFRHWYIICRSNLLYQAGRSADNNVFVSSGCRNYSCSHYCIRVYHMMEMPRHFSIDSALYYVINLQRLNPQPQFNRR